MIAKQDSHDSKQLDLLANISDALTKNERDYLPIPKSPELMRSIANTPDNKRTATDIIHSGSAEYLRFQTNTSGALRTAVSELVSMLPNDTEEIVTDVNPRDANSSPVQIRLRLNKRLSNSDRSFLVFLLDYANKNFGLLDENRKPRVSVEGHMEFAKLLSGESHDEIVQTPDGYKLVIDDSNPSRVNFSIRFSLRDVKSAGLLFQRNKQIDDCIASLSDIEYKVLIINKKHGVETEFTSKLVRDLFTQRFYANGKRLNKKVFSVSLHPALLIGNLFSSRWLDSRLFNGFSRVTYIERNHLLRNCSATLNLIRICNGIYSGKAKFVGFDKHKEGDQIRPILFSTSEFFLLSNRTNEKHNPDEFKAQNRLISETINKWIADGLISGFEKKHIRKTSRTPSDIEWTIIPTEKMVKEFKRSFFIEKRAQYMDLATQLIHYYGVEKSLSTPNIKKLQDILTSNRLTINDIDDAIHAFNETLSAHTGLPKMSL